jgi:ABC-type cobalamin/Fe3+-siderophores transport system ATPase subunit
MTNQTVRSSMKATFRISNYRCFPVDFPATVELGDGETAVVGANNSGKSTLLRFFYEFRTLFESVGQKSRDLIPFMRADTRAFEPAKYTGHIENLFNYNNTENISINLEVECESYALARDSLDIDLSGTELPNAMVLEVIRSSNTFHAHFVGSEGEEISLTSGSSGEDPATIRDPSRNRPLVVAHYLDAFRRIAKSVHFGPFRNALAPGDAAPHMDLTVGKSVIDRWNRLKTGRDPNTWRRIDRATDVMKRVFRCNYLDIQGTNDQSDFIVTIDNTRNLLSTMGAGVSQFIIALTTLAAIDSPSFIFIDEPELHLHPSLQAEFISTLRSFASNGVLFTTHSVGLARVAADRIYTVRRNDGYSSVRVWEKTGRLSELIGEMGFSAYQDLGFDTILLVEGPTEIKTIQQVLRVLRNDHRIVPIELGGSSMINGTRAHELEEIKRITANVYALVDSERTFCGAAPPKDRQDFMNACEDAGIKCHLTERRATENYLTEAAVREATCQHFRSLEPFQKLEELPRPRWGKNEMWTIASKMSAEDWRSTDVGKFLADI